MSAWVARRALALQGKMAEASVGCALVTDPVNVYYVTGFLCSPFERFLGAVVPANGEPILIVPALEKEHASGQAGVQRVLSYRDDEDPYLLLARVLGESGVSALAVEKKHLTILMLERISGAIPGLTVVDASPWLEQLRACKDEGEVELLRKAADLTCCAIADGIAAIEEGASEAETASLLDHRLRCLGADGPAFGTAVLIGSNSALPHGVPGQRSARPGDLVLFDFGARYRGYCADITRTFAFRDIPPELERVYGAVLAAEQAGIEAVRAGRTVAEVDREARRVLEQAGLGEYFVHRTGHGLGLQPHEYPSLAPGGTARLEPGMVVTVEPGVYLPGVGGIRIEDDVLVTESGPVVLTEYPRELKVIG